MEIEHLHIMLRTEHYKKSGKWLSTFRKFPINGSPFFQCQQKQKICIFHYEKMEKDLQVLIKTKKNPLVQFSIFKRFDLAALEHLCMVSFTTHSSVMTFLCLNNYTRSSSQNLFINVSFQHSSIIIGVRWV